jgi:hypothetical protein
MLQNYPQLDWSDYQSDEPYSTLISILTQAHRLFCLKLRAVEAVMLSLLLPESYC